MTEAARAVFLSYASQDGVAAQRICNALRAAGIEVWFDQSELRGGDAWDAAIRHQIKSCGLFIPIVSANTVGRIEGYFRLEWKLAIDRSHLIAPDQPFLLPVVVDATSQDSERIPERFREMQWTRIPEGNAPEAFVQRIAHLLARSQSVAALPAAAGIGTGSGIGSPPHRAVPGLAQRRMLLVLVAAMLLVIAAGSIVHFLRGHGAQEHAAADGTAAEKSIAVLPFENLSNDPSNAYFAAGIQDEILSRLAGVKDLKVISRTSTEKYKSRPDNLRKVAAELGVGNVLEGSVQKAADKVRVNVQLIDADRDTHVWAKSYDRDLKDVFGVESEVSQNIADALKATLSSRETQALAALPTRNSAAYDVFLKGEFEFHQATNAQTGAHYDEADGYYREATRLDPDFAEAYARWALSRMGRHWFIKALSPEELAEVKAAAERAQQLRPDLSAAHEALGIYYYHGFRDYEPALAEFAKALALQPNNSEVRLYRAAVFRRQGRWTESLAEFQRAVELAPRDAAVAAEYGTTLVIVRRYADAQRVLVRALALDPAVMQAVRLLATDSIDGYGDIVRAAQVLAAAPPGLLPQVAHLAADVGEIDQRIYLQVLQRRFPEALKAWSRISTSGDQRIRQLFGQITVRLIAGQRSQARSDCSELRQSLDEQLVQDIDRPVHDIEQSWSELCLGNDKEAIALAQRAAQLLPLSRDAYYGAYYVAGLAQIYA
ncbi:MAG: TIR domain-containing protein, partial [Sinobacteraceae bacterium]|nr:TIR domain-containing protein [Nevskiaceae bacterium]